jgi:hypothetical protein
MGWGVGVEFISGNISRKNLQTHFSTHLFNLVFIISKTLKEASIVYRLQRLRAGRFEARIAVETREFLMPRKVHTESGAHATSYLMGTEFVSCI